MVIYEGMKILIMNTKFHTYYKILEKWNAKINLMSVADEKEFFTRHVEDVQRCSGMLRGIKRIVDLGSGAGVPGLIIKILNPSIDVTLVEATRKKVSFCEEVGRVLKLKGVSTIWGRVEDEGIMKGLGAFDAAISRATWNLSEYLPIAARYVDISGLCMAMKGKMWKDEMNKASTAIDASGLSYDDVFEYRLDNDRERALVIFKKTQNPFEVE